MIPIRGTPFRAGSDFPPEWVGRHINAKYMYLLHGLLTAYCASYPLSLKGAQACVDNQGAMLAFDEGRSRDTPTHWLLLDLFSLEVRHGSWFRLRWVPTDANLETDQLSPPGVEEHVRLRSHSFASLWRALGPFRYDSMKSSRFAQRVPPGELEKGRQLPLFVRCACPGTCRVGVLAQDLAQWPKALLSSRLR